MLIALPFINERLIFNYQTQRWIPVRWERTVTMGNRTLSLRTRKNVEVVTNELAPQLRSRFVVIAPLVAFICGIISALPDLGTVAGRELDHEWWAYLCFGHPLFDANGAIGPIIPTEVLVGLSFMLLVMVELAAWQLVSKRPE